MEHINNPDVNITAFRNIIDEGGVKPLKFDGFRSKVSSNYFWDRLNNLNINYGEFATDKTRIGLRGAHQITFPII